jgi:hypothetical protein
MGQRKKNCHDFTCTVKITGVHCVHLLIKLHLKTIKEPMNQANSQPTINPTKQPTTSQPTKPTNRVMMMMMIVCCT